MPRKNKGRNKNRKSSGIGSTQGRQRDDVTGLTIEVDGFGSITSDKVYDKNSSFVKNTFLSEGDQEYFKEFDLEVEFDKEFIIANIRTLSQDSRVSTSRTVFQGEFKYEGRMVKSARIDYIAQVSGGEYGWGTLQRLGISIPQPSSAASWQSSLDPIQGTVVAEYDIGINTPGEVTGNYQGVVSFGNGRFFYEGWENEPFSSNLL